MKNGILIGIVLAILVVIGADYYIISFQSLTHTNASNSTTFSSTQSTSYQNSQTTTSQNSTNKETNNIQLIPNKAFYYNGYVKSRLFINGLYFYVLHGNDTIIDSTSKGMNITTINSVIAIGYIIPGYYYETTVDFSFNQQGPFGVFLKIFNTSQLNNEQRLDSIVIAFYKPPTAQPPDAIYLYNITIPIIINGTEENVIFMIYKSPIHIFFIPQKTLLGNITLILKYFTEASNYTLPYQVGIFDHSTLKSNTTSIATDFVYNWSLDYIKLFQNPNEIESHIPNKFESIMKEISIHNYTDFVIIKNGSIELGGEKYYALNSGMLIVEHSQPNNVSYKQVMFGISQYSNAETYSQIQALTIGLAYHILNGTDNFGIKIASNQEVYLLLYSSNILTSSKVVRIPMEINGHPVFMNFYEIKNDNVIYLYPENDIKSAQVVINAEIVLKVLKIPGEVYYVDLGNILPSSNYMYSIFS